MRATRRDVLRALAAGSLGTVLGCRGRASGAIEGSIVDEDHDLGHRLRDGSLTPSSFRREKVPVLIAGGGGKAHRRLW